jgi:membrane-associated protease RseP (regulator of RpoE activity)
MGIFAALGLFFSIVFHELCHSLVARKFNLEARYGYAFLLDKEEIIRWQGQGFSTPEVLK